MLTAVFCDSVLGGRDRDAPAVREGLVRAGITSELLLHAMPFRTVEQQTEPLRQTLLLGPDLVVVGHGGSEGLTFARPEGAGVRPTTAAGVVTAWSRRNPVVSKLRREARCLLRPPGLPAVPFGDFAASYRRFVTTVVEESRAVVVLLTAAGSDPKFFPKDPTYPPRARALMHRLAAEHADRVVVVDPEPHLRHWEDFQPDRAHLSRSGEAALAGLLARAFTDAVRRDAPTPTA